MAHFATAVAHVVRSVRRDRRPCRRSAVVPAGGADALRMARTGPHRGDRVLRLLENDFPFSVFLGEAEVGALGRELGRLRITGGSVYDGLVGAAARHHRVPLLSRDGRARPTYEALGVELEPFAN